MRDFTLTNFKLHSVIVEKGFEVVNGDGLRGYFLAFNPDVLVAGFGEWGAWVEIVNINCKPLLVVV